MEETQTVPGSVEQQKEKRVTTSIHREAGAPQRMQRRITRAEAEEAPPSLAELQERQDEISPTRRPTKYRDEREEVDPESIPVPDVPPTGCR